MRARTGGGAVDNPRDSPYTARTRVAGKPLIRTGIITEVVTIRALDASILWNSTVSPRTQGRVRFWCFVKAQDTVEKRRIHEGCEY